MPLRRRIDTVTPLASKWRRASSIIKGKVAQVMKAAGKLVAKESARRAPVLRGNLEASHRSKIIRNNADQIKIEVSVGGMVGGVNVDAYVTEMHEHLGGPKYPGGLGPESRKKQAADPSVRVGRKFLERALADTEDEILELLEDTLFGEIS